MDVNIRTNANKEHGKVSQDEGLIEAVLDSIVNAKEGQKG